MQPDFDKVKAIESVMTPTTVRQNKSFIGMTSYYCRFIRNFSDIAKLLINLMRKYAHFQWDDIYQAAFDSLKMKLAKMVILVYPDPNRDYGLYTYTSDESIGACLSQMLYDQKDKKINCFFYFLVEKTIYFLSHKLSDTQTRW